MTKTYKFTALGYRPQVWCEIFDGNRFVATTPAKFNSETEAIAAAETIYTDMSGITGNGAGVKK